MKKKLFLVILTMIVSFSLAACGDKAGEKEDENVQETVTAQADGESDQMEETEETEALDTSLTGESLIDSIKGSRPKTMKLETELSTFGMSTKTITYYDGDDTRTETDVPEMGKNVLIYLSDEGTMYSYVEGGTDGIKMTGVDMSYAEEMDIMMDTSDLFAEITSESSEDLSAKVENLDGEEVVYIEATETDEEMGEVFVKMWYSVKYGTPLKYEVIMGEKSMMELKVTSIEKDIKIDQSLFTPPSDVNFQEADMNAMFDE